tara:strand:- start:294 stop:512 length:219 start_codon:yes stop_codon:yes gene_type:complete
MNLLQLFDKYADYNGVSKLGDLLEKNDYGYEYWLYLRKPETLTKLPFDLNLVRLLETNLEPMPFNLAQINNY